MHVINGKLSLWIRSARGTQPIKSTILFGLERIRLLNPKLTYVLKVSSRFSRQPKTHKLWQSSRRMGPFSLLEIREHFEILLLNLKLSLSVSVICWQLKCSFLE